MPMSTKMPPDWAENATKKPRVSMASWWALTARILLVQARGLDSVHLPQFAGVNHALHSAVRIIN